MSPRDQAVRATCSLPSARTRPYGAAASPAPSADATPPTHRHIGGAHRVDAAGAVRVGVTCQVGYPPYTQEDWDNRTRTELLKPRIDVTWADVGLYPPGKTAPRKFFPAVAPPRPERKLHTWIEQL